LHPVFKELQAQDSLPSPLLIVSQKHEELVAQTVEFCRSRLRRKAKDHPDLMLFTIEPGSKTYSLDTIRQIIDEMTLPPFEEKFRYFILDQVETMLPVHQNALLKALEEHPSCVKCILLARSAAPLLQTILSRVKKFTIDASQELCPVFPNFHQPFSYLHQEVQNFDDKASFVDLENGQALFNQLSESALLWTLEGQRAETMHIKKKHLLESLYAKWLLG